MRKYITYTMAAFFAMIAVSFAVPTKDAILAKETAAWQTFKDKKADDFKKIVDKDIRCVYDNGVSHLQKELDDMKNADIKSFTISDFDMFSDEKDVVVTTYTVKLEGTMNGKDMSGTYNAGSVWKQENGVFMAVFHTHIKQAEPMPAAAK